MCPVVLPVVMRLEAGPSRACLSPFLLRATSPAVMPCRWPKCPLSPRRATTIFVARFSCSRRSCTLSLRFASYLFAQCSRSRRPAGRPVRRHRVQVLPASARTRTYRLPGYRSRKPGISWVCVRRRLGPWAHSSVSPGTRRFHFVYALWAYGGIPGGVDCLPRHRRRTPPSVACNLRCFYRASCGGDSATLPPASSQLPMLRNRVLYLS